MRHRNMIEDIGFPSLILVIIIAIPFVFAMGFILNISDIKRFHSNGKNMADIEIAVAIIIGTIAICLTFF